MPLEKADISKLLATGWKPPMPIKMTAPDGKTDIYGLMFRPTNFDPAKKYPIVNHVYPGPQTGSTGSRAFTAARGDRQALAELGFIVVTIDGRGTPGRSKAFQDAYYGAMGRDNTIPDQIAGMKELAKKYPWIDLDARRDLGPLGRRLRDDDRDVPLSRLLQGRHRRIGQPRSARERRRLGRALSGSGRQERRRHRQLRRRSEPELREEPQGPSPARARHDGHQRAAVSDRCWSPTR